MKKPYLQRLMAVVTLSLLSLHGAAQTTPLPQNFQAQKQQEYDAMPIQEITFPQFYDAAKEDFYRVDAIQTGLAAAYIPGSVMHTPCGNGDFETGLSTTEWQGGYGSISSTGSILYGSFTNGILSGPYNSASARQTLVTTGSDPVLLASSPSIVMSQVAPGGSTRAVRIGNAVNGNGAELLSKSFVVTSASSVISFWYALVLQNPTGHPANAQPAFRVRVIDNSTGLEITGVADLGGGSNVAVADASNPFFQSTTYNGSPLVYRNWSCAQINLSGHVGTSVTVQFVTNDCAYGAHFGYAYIDNFCGNCNTPNNPSGSINFNSGSSTNCGRGQLCFTYTLPKQGSVTGSVTIILRIYQNGVLVATLTSPTLTSGTSYCFNIDPLTMSGINTSLYGLDFTATGAFAIGSTSLPSLLVGIPPQGQVTGLNNDYQLYCDRQCCPGKNAIKNGSFEQGNTSFMSMYSYEPTVALNSVGPGEYSILTSAQALSVSPTWNPACPAYGHHLVVNGLTAQSGSRLVWRQNITIQRGRTYRFCADFKNLPQCAFDIKPKVSVLFSTPGFDVNNVVINVGSTGCAWQQISQNVLVPGTGSMTLSVEIWLDETGIGDGNDLAIDNIAMIAIPQVPVSDVVFSVVYQNVTSTTFNLAATPATPLGSGCGFFWQVEELNAGDSVVPGTQVVNPAAWWPLVPTNTFNGYNGTSTLVGTSPGVFQLNKKYRIIYGRWCPCASWNAYAVILDPLNNAAIRIDSTYQVDEEEIVKAIKGQSGGTATPIPDGQARKAPSSQGADEAKVFPNPTENKVTVLLPKNETGGKLELLNASGQVLKTIDLQPSELRIDVSLTEQPAGLYLLRVNSKEGVMLLNEKVVRL